MSDRYTSVAELMELRETQKARIAELEQSVRYWEKCNMRDLEKLSDAVQTMKECADELEKALKESTHFLDIGLDVTEKLIAKLRGQSQ